MAEIKIGTIGTGSIVHNILKNFDKIQGINLEAVYSRREESGKKLADLFGAKKIYTDINTFLCDNEMNTVYVASPNNLHYIYTKMALEAGKNVICEKPFTPDISKAEELIKMADERNLMLIEAVPTTFLPNFDYMKKGLDKIGKVKLVQANYSQYSSRYDNLLNEEITNVFNPDFSGGSLMDINYYNVYLTIALFGTPESAEYHPNLYKLPEDKLPIRSSEKHIDTSGIMIMNYDGFVAECSGAKDTWGVNFYMIEGEKGFIYAEEGGNGMKSVRIVTKDSDEIYNLQTEDRLYYEFKALSDIMGNSKIKELGSRMEITKKAVALVERTRKAAGIHFLQDFMSMQN